MIAIPTNCTVCLDNLQLLQRLIWRHNILTEEVEGVRSCVISLHNLLHLTDDIRRFSSPDNVWCYVYERAVHTYIERSSNMKNLELTFARAQSRRELLKFISYQDMDDTHVQLQVHQEGNVNIYIYVYNASGYMYIYIYVCYHPYIKQLCRYIII